MIQAGIRKVVTVRGGLQALIDAGYPTVP